MKKVTIVGGGTAGWFAAAWLAKYHPNLIITLIESPNIPKIGVGETVTPHVAQFFKQLGINDKVWISQNPFPHAIVKNRSKSNVALGHLLNWYIVIIRIHCGNLVNPALAYETSE